MSTYSLLTADIDQKPNSNITLLSAIVYNTANRYLGECIKKGHTMRALEDITILDLTHMLSGPYATQLMADMGANTIKIEPPQGEATRQLLADSDQYAIEGQGAYFLTLCRNKKSVCLNLKTEEGKNIFYQLVKKADVVVNNFAQGVPH